MAGGGSTSAGQSQSHSSTGAGSNESNVFVNKLIIASNPDHCQVTVYGPDGNHVSWESDVLRVTLMHLRGVMKHVFATGDVVAACCAFGALLRSSYYDCSKSEYRSIGCVLAAAMGGQFASEGIQRAADWGGNARPAAWKEIHSVGKALSQCIRMDSVMQDGGGTNMYSLIHAVSCYTTGNCKLYMYGVLCASVQLGMALYVLIQLVHVSFDEMGLNRLPLAIVVTLYALLATEGMVSKWMDVRQSGFWRNGMGVLRGTNFLVNVLIPVLLIPAGFVLIATSETLMDSVLNSTALLFIPLLDDEMPAILRLNSTEVMQSFVIRKGVDALIDLAHAREESECFKSVPEQAPRVFDLHLSPKDPKDMFACNLHQVIIVEGAPVVLMTEVINEFCLFRTARFRYRTHGSKNPDGIDQLELVRLSGEELTVKFRNERIKEEKHTSQHTITGCFVITRWSSSDVLSELRIFGASTVADFEDALTNFALWDLSSTARKLIKEAAKDSPGSANSESTALLQE